MNYLGSKITNDARRTREIKSRHFVAKSAFNKIFFSQQIGLKFKTETSKVLRLEYGAETGTVWEVDRKKMEEEALDLTLWSTRFGRG